MKIKKILIANRAEIAIRVMRTAKEMGIKTVAVYSEADIHSPHVSFADEAYHIGPSPASESYLRQEKIIEVALESGAQAIHPGYGFLSENAEFCQKVKDAGLIFIGPDPKAISIMGNKLAAKDAVKGFDIPMVPGTDEALSDVSVAKDTAKEIGFPVLIKAAAGGGGKGMRVVEKMEEFEDQLALATSEAQSSFGDGSVFIEKFVTSPRHIEIQILSDRHGNHLYLNERDCSIQRRHQKVVEEAPSAVVGPELRKRMGEAAVNVARACDYVGAGTVEFLFDEKQNFYFLEMNTRLQVEHPVTEMTTGIDLVKQQILIASGEELKIQQKDIGLNGHSIELRVYAEDSENNFAPDIGKLISYRPPEGVGVRVDDGFEEGMDIPIYYDPMIAKLVVHAQDRASAIDRLLRAIDEYEIVGVKTTLDFARFAVNHEAFRSGNFDTNFVKKYFSPESLSRNLSADEQDLLAVIASMDEEHFESRQVANSGGTNSTYRGERSWQKNRGGAY